jgi:hypothetical protein
MDGHWPPGAQTAGKQALMVTVVIVKVQQEALLPQEIAQVFPAETPVQKQGKLAGIA